MSIKTSSIHHLMLTVSKIERTKQFYHGVLGMDVMAEAPDGTTIAFTNGTLLLAARTPFDEAQTPSSDRFNENRYGLDHVSLTVDSRRDLKAAIQLFDEHNVKHGEIKDLSERGLPILVLAFRDPDNIQLELSAPA